MLVALEEHFPANAGGRYRAVACLSGLNWMTQSTVPKLQLAIEQEQVAFIPGFCLAVKPGLSLNFLRLNFSNCSVTAIEDGIGRLGRVLQQYHH